MDRQTILAFVLIGAILMIWLYMNTPDPVPVEGPLQDSVITETDKSTEPVKDKPEEKIKGGMISDQQRDSLKLSQFFVPFSGAEKIIKVETDLVIIELSNKGGNFHKVFLKKYNNWYSSGINGNNTYKTKVQLINYSLGNTYDLSFISSDGKAINTGELKFEVDKFRNNFLLEKTDSLTLVFTHTTPTGNQIKKSYTFYGDKYGIRSRIELINMQEIISNNAYDLLWQNGLRFVEENSVDESNYSNASVFYGDEQVIVDASDAGEIIREDFNGRIDWLTVRNKYFASVIIPDKPHEIEGAYIEGLREVYPNQGVREFYDVRLNLPFLNTSHEKRSFLIYLGPVDYETLQSYGKNLEAIVDFGSFFGLKFIVRPIAEYILLPLFTFLHTFIPNYGFVIIVFSLIIKFVLYPLTKTSYKSMKKMQLLQPKILELKEKFKDDPQKLNKETMKLYQTYGVNPAGGCLPLLLQMPIFIALWGLFQTALELRQQPFIWWIKDLSRPDVIFDLGFKLPLFGIQEISALAILMGITTFFQQKMSVKDPKQQSLVYIMPVMLTILFMTFPSGLNLYYFMFNVFSIAQQYYINHKHDDMELRPVKNAGKKKGFMQRMMEAAEQSAKTQQKRKR